MAFDGAKDRMETRLRTLLSADDGLAGTLYKSCLDEATIEQVKRGQLRTAASARQFGVDDEACLVMAGWDACSSAV